MEFRPCVVGTRSADPFVDFLPQTILSSKPAILMHGLASEAELTRLVRSETAKVSTPIRVWTVYSRGGRRPPHGCAASNAADARSTVRSAKRRPTICRPTGRPAGVNPAGTEAAGWPVKLNG